MSIVLGIATIITRSYDTPVVKGGSIVLGIATIITLAFKQRTQLIQKRLQFSVIGNIIAQIPVKFARGGIGLIPFD